MMTLVAPCAIGAEKVLANELKQLGYIPAANAPGRVVFGTADDFAGAFRANLCLRTADRIYVRLAYFPCSDFDELFEGVKAIRWQDWFKKDARVVVDKVRTHASKLNSEHSIQSVTHKAIYECLGAAWKMSLISESGEAVSVRVYIEQNIASILLDLSGMPLHRRGYRTAGGEAPIRETLAAVLLQLMSWRRKTPLHDAFCGSGTIPIEAILYAHNIAPGLGRAFALENLAPFCGADMHAVMDEERKKAARAIRTDCLVRVTGSDVDETVLISARANAERACVIAGRAMQAAGLDSRIPRPDFAHASFEELAAPFPEGLLLSNPPWGERLTDRDEASKLYSSMHCLFRNFPGWDFGFITSHDGFEEAIGRKATKRRELKSGNLDTRFYQYKKENE